MKISVPGFLASGISSGIKEKNKKDLGMLFSEQPATAVGAFTTNKIKAAPVLISKEKIKQKNSQAIIVNSGNANACTGDMGLKDASDLCKLTAEKLGVSEKLVMVSSTGIIGVALPMDKIKTNIPHLVDSLSPMGLNDFAEAIMTTDTIPKIVMKKSMIDSKEVTFCGIAKGSGMIMPRMATLLAFIITDVAINPELLDDVFIEAVNNSFNRITIDGETSTNDMVIMMANGRAANTFFPKESSDYQTFKSLLNDLFLDLSKLILKDAEGATKTIYVRVEEAKSNEEANKIAFQIANSNLVKTAFFGEDPNWGRILSAIGTVDAEIIPGRIDISFDDVTVVKNSIRTGMEIQAKQILMKKEFQVTINLHIGQGTAEVGTTDLTTEYVKINASYPS